MIAVSSIGRRPLGRREGSSPHASRLLSSSGTLRKVCGKLDKSIIPHRLPDTILFNNM